MPPDPRAAAYGVVRRGAGVVRRGAALYGHVAEVGCEVVAFALWFQNFSTWDGVHGIYLEDLFVRPEHRGCGYSRLQWWALDWNAPAIGFYSSIGAKPMDEWTVYRITGQALTALASNR